MIKKIFAILLIFSFAVLSAGVLYPVKNRKANAVIVIPPDADRVEKFAAKELQEHIRELTGATLVVVSAKSDGKINIFLGSKFASGFPEDLKKLGRTDGYAIRRKGDDICIFGAISKGTLNGVYSFIETNSDLIWARPLPEGRIFTPSEDFAAKVDNVLDIPKSSYRGWFLVTMPFDHNSELWNARMRLNRNPTRAARGHLKSYELSLDTGMLIETIGEGHSLAKFMPKKYFETNPEFFCLIDGIRRKDVGKNQLCFSNMKCAEIVAANFIREVKKCKFKTDLAGINIQDNWNSCECTDCLKPLKLANGKVLKNTDKAFRSTQFFVWLNKVAQLVKKELPNVPVTTFAYFFTVEPPEVDLMDNIYLVFCPAVKNDKYSLLHPKNKLWKSRVEKWTGRTGNFVWREYYGCSAMYPRELDRIAGTDFRFLLKNGCDKFFAELPPDLKYGKSRCDWSWDASAMGFWIISKLYWNPDLDATKLREEYLQKCYQKSAPYMKTFYDLLRTGFVNDPSSSTLSDKAAISAGKYIIRRNLTDRCRKALSEAEKHANQPKIKNIIKRQRALFENWIKEASMMLPPQSTAVKISSGIDPMKEDCTAWEKAGSITSFCVMGRAAVPAQNKIEIKILHDGKNLYFRFVMPDNTSKLTAKKRVTANEVFPEGDHVEWFISPDKSGYWHLATDIYNQRYDGQAYNSTPDIPWECKVILKKDRWTVLAKVPFDAVGIKSDAGEFGAMFVREAANKGKNGRSEYSSWNGGMVHQPAGFGNIILEK